MITIEQLTKALADNGITTEAELAAFLKPAGIATKVRALQGQVEKLEAAFAAERTSATAAHNAEITALRAQIEALEAELRQ